MTRPRILMADDHSLVLAGLRRLIEEEGDVVGTVEDGRALLEEAHRLPAGHYLLGHFHAHAQRPRCRKATQAAIQTAADFLTMHATPAYGPRLLRSGLQAI